MKPLFIVNPRSGGGRTGRVFESLRGTIERIVGEIEIAFTERPRHAVDIAKEATESGRETIIAVGGDGSTHEVMCGIMAAREGGAETKTRLGILGQGTGGDFCRTLGIEHRLDKYCKIIAAGQTRDVDIGRFSYQTNEGATETAFFINILSVGLGGLVDRYVADMGRTMGGKAAYFLASVRGLVESEIGHLKCTVRHKGSERVINISTRQLAVCNGRYFGSGMFVAPMAELSDGQFEVVSLGAANKLKFALESSRIYTGKHLSNPEVSHFSCDRIEIELENERISDKYLLDVDGEPLGRLPMTIDILPRALPVLSP